MNQCRIKSSFICRGANMSDSETGDNLLKKKEGVEVEFVNTGS